MPLKSKVTKGWVWGQPFNRTQTLKIMLSECNAWLFLNLPHSSVGKGSTKEKKNSYSEINEPIGNFQYIHYIRQYYYHSVIFLGILGLFYFLRQWYFKNLGEYPFFFGEQWQNVWEDVSCSLYLAFKWFQSSIYIHICFIHADLHQVFIKRKRDQVHVLKCQC